MKLTVGRHGVTVPKHMLGDAEEVDVRYENGRIVLEPISQSDKQPQADDQTEDPILGLGQDPVSCGASDASEHHDQYLYGE